MINQNIIFKYIEEEALHNENIFVVCGDGLDKAFFPNLLKSAPHRVIACGISEQNQVSVANGIALGGKKVYCLMMQAFLVHRALDQLKMACYSNADIKFLGFTPNIVAMAGGYSHISIDDIPILRNTPNLEIYDPYTIQEIKKVVEKSFKTNTPMYISCPLESIDYLHNNTSEYGGFTKLINGSKDFCIISSGDALTYLFSGNEIQNITKNYTLPTCFSAYQIEPFDKQSCKKIVSQYKHIMTFESRGKGALAGSVAEVIAQSGKKTKLLPVYFDNEKYNFCGYGDYAARKCLNFDNLHNVVKNFFLKRKNYIFKEKCKQTPESLSVKYKVLGLTYKRKVWQ